MLCAVIPFLSGIVVCDLVHIPLLIIILFITVSSFAAIICFFISRFSLSIALLMPAFFFLGALSLSLQESALPERHIRRLIHSYPGILENTGVEVSGVIARTIEKSKGGTSVVVRLSEMRSPRYSGKAKGALRLFIPDRIDAGKYLFTPGDGITAYARLRMPRSFGNPGAFDYQRYLLAQGIDLTGSTKSFHLVNIEKRSGLHPIAKLSTFRQRLIYDLYGIGESCKDRDEIIGIVCAMTLGNRDGISSATARKLRMGGIYHIIAISGLHCWIIAFLLFKCLRSMKLHVMLACHATSLCMLVFLVLSGERNSATRAVIMSIIYLTGRSLQRRHQSINCIAVAAYGMLIFNPVLAYDPGFQLTFTATASLILFFSPFKKCTRWAGPISPVLAASLAAQIGVLPIIAYHFNTISLFSLLANVVAAPSLFMIVPLGIAVEILTLINHSLASELFLIVSIPVKMIIWCASLSFYFPFLSFRIPSPPLIVVFFYYCTALCALLLKSNPFLRRISFILFLIFLAIILIYPFAPSTTEHLEVTFLDVGQGDAACVIFPDGHCILIDAGQGGESSFDAGEFIVSKYLFARGFKKINTIIASHLHHDHAGGIPALLDNFHVDRVLVSAREDCGSLFRKIARNCEMKGTQLITVREQFQISAGTLDIKIRDPERRSWRESDRNERSLIVILRYGNIRFLFMGDAPRSVERALIDSADTIDCHILKVAHHGSDDATSESFLRKTTPDVCIISVATSNPWGHPAQAVVNRIEGMGAHLLRTDKDGATSIYCDGETFFVHTFLTGKYLLCAGAKENLLEKKRKGDH